MTCRRRRSGPGGYLKKILSDGGKGKFKGPEVMCSRNTKRPVWFKGCGDHGAEEVTGPCRLPYGLRDFGFCLQFFSKS